MLVWNHYDELWEALPASIMGFDRSIPHSFDRTNRMPTGTVWHAWSTPEAGKYSTIPSGKRRFYGRVRQGLYELGSQSNFG